MAAINSIKKNNAKILLADGSEINATGDNISFKELGGMLGHMMLFAIGHRGSFEQLEMPYTEELLVSVAEARALAKSGETPKDEKQKETLNTLLQMTNQNSANHSSSIAEALLNYASNPNEVSTHIQQAHSHDLGVNVMNISSEPVTTNFDNMGSIHMSNDDSDDDSEGTVDLLDGFDQDVEDTPGSTNITGALHPCVPSSKINSSGSLSDDEEDDIPESVLNLKPKIETPKTEPKGDSPSQGITAEKGQRE